MTQQNFLHNIGNPKCEADVQFFAKSKLESNEFGYIVHQHKIGNPKLDKAFPSKKRPGKSGGKPDLLLCCSDEDYPVCVWENKEPSVKAIDALKDAQFYIEGLFKKLPNEPALPRLAAGFNGVELCLSFYNTQMQWVQIKSKGHVLKDYFITSSLARNGVNNKGEFLAVNGWATEKDLRELLPKLKTLYRYIPALTHGRKPIDFTIALLTLRMLVERNKNWGSWTEQPSFSIGTETTDQSIRERFKVLLDRIISDHDLNSKYGQIFDFKENNDGDEIAFSFLKTLESIPVQLKANKSTKEGNFEKLFSYMDYLPPLEHADFDVFGEVYQHIGDNATKKALGQFFTGRHIISAFLPILAVRSGIDQDEERVKNITVCDPACGTGGFLTEFFRLIKQSFPLSPTELSTLSKHAFFGFDLSRSNSSRASVNMYFAGDGFSRIEGGRDSLDYSFKQEFKNFFDFCVTNPPYGKSSYGRAQEVFLNRVIDILKPGGWALIVLPTGTLENPRSVNTRFGTATLFRT